MGFYSSRGYQPPRTRREHVCNSRLIIRP
jgi:hypothetical protein